MKISLGDHVEIVWSDQMPPEDYWVGARGVVVKIGKIRWPLILTKVTVKLAARDGPVEVRLGALKVLNILDLLAEI